jgi:hypothetical protein
MACAQRPFSAIFSPRAFSMLSCRTVCLSSRLFYNGARVDCGKNSTRCMGPCGSAPTMAGSHVSSSRSPGDVTQRKTPTLFALRRIISRCH